MVKVSAILVAAAALVATVQGSESEDLPRKAKLMLAWRMRQRAKSTAHHMEGATNHKVEATKAVAAEHGDHVGMGHQKTMDGQSCYFPFVYAKEITVSEKINGRFQSMTREHVQKFTSCTFEGYEEEHKNPWCATAVDDKGHVSKWAECAIDLPPPLAESLQMRSARASGSASGSDSENLVEKPVYQEGIVEKQGFKVREADDWLLKKVSMEEFATSPEGKVLAKNGKQCVFPFKYSINANLHEYDGCTQAGDLNGQRWCATSIDEHKKVMEWDHCAPRASADVDLNSVIRENQAPLAAADANGQTFASPSAQALAEQLVDKQSNMGKALRREVDRKAEMLASKIAKPDRTISLDAETSEMVKHMDEPLLDAPGSPEDVGSSPDSWKKKPLRKWTAWDVQNWVQTMPVAAGKEMKDARAAVAGLDGLAIQELTRNDLQTKVNVPIGNAMYDAIRGVRKFFQR